MSPVVTVLGGKGGSGKSTLAMGLAMWASKLIELKPKKFVVLIGGDPGVRTITFKMCRKASATLYDVLAGTQALEQAVYACDLENPSTGELLFPNLAVLPSSTAEGAIFPELEGSPFSSLIRTARQFDGVVKKLRKISPLIIVDTPATPGYEHMILAGAADGVLYVVEPSSESVDITERTMADLEEHMGIPTLGLVLNRLPPEEDQRKWVEKIKAIGPLLGVVPEDKKVQETFIEDYPVVAAFPRCPASLAMREIALKLIKIKVKPTELAPKLERTLKRMAEALE
jgi:MinD-like ATPase involved in chromosome partitioning or flagellar assembly